MVTPDEKPVSFRRLHCAAGPCCFKNSDVMSIRQGNSWKIGFWPLLFTLLLLGMLSCESSFKWRVTVSGELMFLEIYGKCDVTNTVTLLL